MVNSAKFDLDEYKKVSDHFDGWHKVACVGKKPIFPWDEATPEKNTEAIKAGRANGIMGFSSDDHIVIDCDTPEFKEYALTLPKLSTPLFKVQTGRGEHWHFKTDGNIRYMKLNGGDIINGKDRKRSIILPGSWHKEAKRHYKVIDQILKSEPLTLADIQPLIDKFPKPKNGNSGDEWSNGNRNHTLNKKLFAAHRRNDTKAIKEIKDKARASGLTEKEIAETDKSAARAAARENAKDGETKPIVIEGKFAGKDARSLSTALRHIGFEVSFNNRSKEENVRNNNDEKPIWEKLNGRTKKYLRERIMKECRIIKITGEDPKPEPLFYGRDKFDDEISGLLYHNDIDPFREWIELLPEWDGTPRVDLWLEDLFGVERTPLNIWASKYCFIGPIERTYQPGSLLRQIPVFKGEGSIGKTASIKEMLPPEYPDWFSQGLNLADEDKKRVESCLGTVIVEIAEMSGSTKAELDSLKNFLTRIDDGKVRLAYARGTESSLRRFVFIGTADRQDFLPNDPAGNVRFVPVVLEHGANVEAYMAATREQLWAEALHRYRNGERAAMPRELAEEQKKIAARFRNKDEYLESKLEVAEDDPRSTSPTGWAVAELMDELGIQSRFSRKLTSTMISRGWEVRPTTIGNRRNLNRWFFVGRGEL